MSKLNLQGKVLHAPGWWGIAEPVKGAAVKIIDIDPLDQDDIILTATTDTNGGFQGMSSDWQDKAKMWVPFPPPGHWATVPSATDALILKAQIKQGSNEITLPFVYLGNTVAAPPLIVNWAPPNPILGKVNGTKCHSPQEMDNKIKTALNQGVSPVKIEVHDQEVIDELKPLALPLNQLQSWVERHILITPVEQRISFAAASGAGATFLILLGVAIIIVAAGVSIATVFIGASVLLAVSNGYSNIEAGIEIAEPGSGGTSKLVINLEK